MTEKMYGQLYQTADNILRQFSSRQMDALEFFNDLSLLLYALAMDRAGFLALLEKTGRQELTEQVLDIHTELRGPDYEFGRAIRKLNYDQWRSLVSCFRTLSLEESRPEFFEGLFDYLLQNMYDKGRIGNFITPKALADMMADMLEPKQGESVMDPVCGSGRLLVSAAKKCGDCVYIGMDVDEKIKTTAFFNLIFHGIEDARLYQGDFLNEKWEGQAGLILANPPYREDIYETIDFVGQIMNTLKPGGRCAVLVPEGFLTNVNRDVIEMRRYLLRKHSPEAVISLPRKIYKPYTVSKSSLILLKKQPAASEHRLFFSCIPEYEGPENEFSDKVYEQDMKEVVKAWKLWERGKYSGGVDKQAVFWTASLKEIEAKEYLLGADHYRRSEYTHAKLEWKTWKERIFSGQEDLEQVVARYFREDPML